MTTAIPTPVIIAPWIFLIIEPTISPTPAEASVPKNKNPKDFKRPIDVILNLPPRSKPTIIIIAADANPNVNTARILPIASFQGCTGIVFSFWKSPRCLSSEIFAGRLVIPETIIEELPELNKKLFSLNEEIDAYRRREEELSIHLNKIGVIEGLEEIIQRLNQRYENKGKYEEQLKQLRDSKEELDRIEKELEDINEGISSNDKEINNKITIFNKYFSKLSERLYNEQFILSADKNKRAYELKITSIGGNLGTGKKKGEIAAFDLAYIQFCEALDIPCLHFILYDQIEIIHDNQINILEDVSSETNSQLVLPVLKDKLPQELDVDLYKVLLLSQNDKLFKQ